MTPIRSVLAVALAAGLLASPALAQTSHLMSVKGTVPTTGCTTGDVWALNERYMLMARRSAGFAVIDAADPRNPVVHNVVPPGYPTGSCNYGVGDIKSDGRYIYATSEGATGGVLIYDSQPDPTNPTYVNTVLHTRLSSVHNCWIDGDTLYCISNRTGLVEVFDVSNKMAPQWLSTLGGGISGASGHDVIVLGGRAYCSLWNGGFAIYDMAVPSLPQLLASHRYTGATTHNCWPSEDRRYLYVTDETVYSSGEGGWVRVFDISNLQAISEVGQYKAGARESVVHNVHVRGDYLFVSYYKEGVRVASLRPDPTNPVEIAHFDTYPGTQGGCFAGCFGSFGFPYAGCWGVYPWTTFSLFVSDMDSGGYILSLDAVGHTLSAASNTVPRGGNIDLSFRYDNDTAATVDGVGVVVLSKVGPTPTFVALWAGAQPLAPMTGAAAPPIRLPVPLALPPMQVEFTGWSGLLRPTLFTDPTPLAITIQ